MRNDDVLVSVVIPAHNAAETIAETLISLFSQTHDRLEVIVCDDASSDGTRKVLEGWEDPRLVVIHNEENLGPGRSRDRAIERASGDWIAFVDADDVCHQERIRRLLEATENATDVVVFDNAIECHHTKTGLVPWRRMRKDTGFGVPPGQWRDIAIQSWLLSERQLLHAMMPAHVIKGERVRHSARRFAEDTEFLLAVLSKGLRLRYLAEPLYYYRITPGSLSSRRNRWEGVAEIFRAAVGSFCEKPDVKNALLQCAERAERNFHYEKFAMVLRAGQGVDALMLAMTHPFLVRMFAKKLLQDLIYEASRRPKRGASRRSGCS
tara:strand:+ start:1085 stop:2050 length:966 start_codon:yes stop_codon:yes gene_type:complete